MVIRMDLHPGVAGVIYSPEGAGFRFFPEDRLHLGLTGAVGSPTHVRTYLRFDLPQIAADEVLVQALLVLHVVDCRPPGSPRPVRLLEPPGEAGWEIAAEMRQPPAAEGRYEPEDGGDLRLDLTALVDTWLREGGSHGVVLAPEPSGLSLLSCGNGRPGEPPPQLRLVLDRLDPARETAVFEAAPGSCMVTGALPPGRILVLNAGPGVVTVTPLLRFARRRPLPMPDTVPTPLPPGGRMLAAPAWDTAAPLFRFVSAEKGAKVLVFPLMSRE